MSAHEELERKIDDVVENLRSAQRCAILIGAGCSVTAGIPTAGGFVDRIKRDFPQAYGRADPKTYPNCMAELPPARQRALIAEYIDNAKINWAHIGIARLIQKGFVDRVLTVNFDPLVVRACALLNEFPAVYDFAASQLFKPADIPDKAIFHLHGQRTGFVLLSTDDDVKRHSKLMAPVFEDAGQGRLWIVVGYSGDNDPVFHHLVNVDRFDNGLYWVGHRTDSLGKHVQEDLLQPDKHAYFISGYDADSFFILLSRKLGVFPPPLLKQPFTHLSRLLDTLTPFTVPNEDGVIDVVSTARGWIAAARDQFEVADTLAAEATQALMAGDYDRVGAIVTRARSKGSLSAELRTAGSWAAVMQGNGFCDLARTKSDSEAARLFAAGYERYQIALEIDPKMAEALYNWGVALSDQAEMNSGGDADELLAEAGEKYAAALRIKPDDHEALHNWGNVLFDQAVLRRGKEADRLFDLSGKKYAAALKIRPDDVETLANWATLLRQRAETKSGKEADRLIAAAGDKYAAALKIKPDDHEALNNWGYMLAQQAVTKSGRDADRLFAKAYEKYTAALDSEPTDHEALINWGTTLWQHAANKTGEKADRMFAAASEKYAAALRIKSDSNETLANWGTMLWQQAATKRGDEADHVFAAAATKYATALKIAPDDAETLANWGSMLLEQAETKKGKDGDRFLEAAEKQYAAALKIDRDDPAVLASMGYVLLSKYRSSKRQRDARDAEEVLLRAEGLDAGSGSYNLACLHSLRGDQKECRHWLEQCIKHDTLPERTHLMRDSDLDNVRGAKWFKGILNRASVKRTAA